MVKGKPKRRKYGESRNEGPCEGTHEAANQYTAVKERVRRYMVVMSEKSRVLI